MKLFKVFLTCVLLVGSLVSLIESKAQTATQAKLLTAQNVKLLSNYKFKRSTAKIVIPKTNQAITEKADDGDPTGPTEDFPVDLADLLEQYSPSHIKSDFESQIPYSEQLYRDHTSLNTYYFSPSGYLLKRDSVDGFDLNFLHRTRVDDSEQDLIVVTFTLLPRQLDGGLSLLQEFANYAIKPANDKPVSLRRHPVSSVRVTFEGLSTFIPEENVKVINPPQKVGDPVRVQATMTQSQKEELVATIRDGGLAGDLVFSTNNGSFELILPYFVSFTDYSGAWLTDVTRLSTADSIENLSPFPLLVSGLVVYAKARSGNKLTRHQIPLAKPVVMGIGSIAKADKTFSQLISSFGDPVSAWPAYDRVSCDECLNEIERDILVSPAQASRTDLPIEAIPNIFSQFSLFKVLVEVRSNLFSPSNEFEEVKTFTLKPDSTQATTVLYINRDDSESTTKFRYRIKPYHLEGINLEFTQWRESSGVMDITITAGDIRPLMPSE